MVTFAHSYLLWILHLKFDYHGNVIKDMEGIHTFKQKSLQPFLLSKENTAECHFNKIFKAMLIHILSINVT